MAVPAVFLAAIANAVQIALSEANMRRPEVQVPPQQQQALAQKVANDVVKLPEIRHLTSTESPWRSRANISAVIALASPLLAYIGYELAEDDREQIAAGIVVAANIFSALFARWARTAARPLGR